MGSLLVAVAVHGIVVAGAWLLAGTAGAVAALAVVLAIEQRLARARALDPHHHKEHRAHR